MTPSTLDPITIPISQQEQVHELQKLMQREGKASLTGKGGEPALNCPTLSTRFCYAFLRVCRKARLSQSFLSRRI